MFLDTDTAGQSVTEALWGRASGPDTPGAVQAPRPERGTKPAGEITPGDMIWIPRFHLIALVTGIIASEKRFHAYLEWERVRFAPGPVSIGVTVLPRNEPVEIIVTAEVTAAVRAPRVWAA